MRVTKTPQNRERSDSTGRDMVSFRLAGMIHGVAKRDTIGVIRDTSGLQASLLVLGRLARWRTLTIPGLVAPTTTSSVGRAQSSPKRGVDRRRRSTSGAVQCRLFSAQRSAARLTLNARHRCARDTEQGSTGHRGRPGGAGGPSAPGEVPPEERAALYVWDRSGQFSSGNPCSRSIALSCSVSSSTRFIFSAK